MRPPRTERPRRPHTPARRRPPSVPIRHRSASIRRRRFPQEWRSRAAQPSRRTAAHGCRRPRSRPTSPRRSSLLPARHRGNRSPQRSPGPPAETSAPIPPCRRSRATRVARSRYAEHRTRPSAPRPARARNRLPGWCPHPTSARGRNGGPSGPTAHGSDSHRCEPAPCLRGGPPAPSSRRTRTANATNSPDRCTPAGTTSPAPTLRVSAAPATRPPHHFGTRPGWFPSDG